MIKSRQHYFLTLVLAMAAFVIVACGGAAENLTPAATSRPVATMPPAKFTAVAEQAASENTNVAPKADTLVTPTSDVSISRGELVYTNRKCGDCHGAQGEGVADKGSALAGTDLNFQRFEDILRTGDNGTLGNSHLYGPSAISPSGMTNLYAFVTSLEK
ncbi:MAG: c-type cytochrome [Caldilineaceae bacterium]